MDVWNINWIARIVDITKSWLFLTLLAAIPCLGQDVSVQSFSAILSGQEVQLNTTIITENTFPQTFDAKFYLSDDSTFSPDDQQLLFGGGEYNSGFQLGMSYDIPCGEPSSSQYFMIVADNLEEIVETDELNNISFKKINIPAVPCSPCLLVNVQQLITQNPVTPGGYENLELRLYNRTDNTIQELYLAAYLSVDGVFNPDNDIELFGENHWLDVEGQVDMSFETNINLYFPPDLNVGDYNLYVQLEQEVGDFCISAGVEIAVELPTGVEKDHQRAYVFEGSNSGMLKLPQGTQWTLFNLQGTSIQKGANDFSVQRALPDGIFILKTSEGNYRILVGK